MTEGQNEFKKPRKPKSTTPPEVSKGLNYLILVKDFITIV